MRDSTGRDRQRSKTGSSAKRGRLLLLAFVLMAALAGGVAPGLTGRGEAKSRVAVIGHRGAAGLLPENTLEAVARALELGADAVEIDVQLSADKVPVVYHDFTLNPDITRGPDGDWLGMWNTPAVRNLTLAQLKTYDVGRVNPYSAYAGRYPDQQPVDGARIPTLREVIGLMKSGRETEAGIFLEIKTSAEYPQVSGDPVEVAGAVLAVLELEDFAERVRILSFDWRALRHIQRVAPAIPTVWLTGRRKGKNAPAGYAGETGTGGVGSPPAAVRAAGGRIWAPHFRALTPRNLAAARQLGVAVYVWTPDRHRDLLRLREMGVDGIITNRPDILRALSAP